MKTRTILSFSNILLFLLISLSAVGASPKSHPALFVDDAEFSKMKKTILSGRHKPLSTMHSTYMKMADECVTKDKPVTFSRNESGKLLKVSREALRQIGCCAYAYRFTKDPRYLWRAESVLNYVCDFPTWNPEHYLDVAEMATAVAIGYDWLYYKLDKQTLTKCENAIKSYLFDTAGQDTPYYKHYRMTNNWGQVLNAGLVVSCIAFKDVYPELSATLLNRAIADNSEFMSLSYAPDGIYPEGHMYWLYGTSYQIMMISALEHYSGSDSGLSECKGFDKSAWFEIFTSGNSGKAFNYSDSSVKIKQHPQLWYFADRFGWPEIVYNEEHEQNDNLGFLWIYYASKVDPKAINAPDRLLFSGLGTQPLVMARTGWEPDDLYLGIKGGCARKNGHAHLDAGSFVFEAYGKRWIEDPAIPTYAKSEKAMRSINASLWKRDQESMRWKVYAYNNRQHSTMTINDTDHDVDGMGELISVIDSADIRGGVFDLSSVFASEAAYVTRKAVIDSQQCLQVIDNIAALPDKDACVKWVFPTEADVDKIEGGFILTLENKKMKLHVDNEDVLLEDVLEQPNDVPDCLQPFYEASTLRFVGFRLTIPAGTSMSIKTTIGKY